eukprot:scaffold82863_cov31-Tisochrysis_lutea.AAC.3
MRGAANTHSAAIALSAPPIGSATLLSRASPSRAACHGARLFAAAPSARGAAREALLSHEHAPRLLRAASPAIGQPGAQHMLPVGRKAHEARPAFLHGSPLSRFCAGRSPHSRGAEQPPLQSVGLLIVWGVLQPNVPLLWMLTNRRKASQAEKTRLPKSRLEAGKSSDSSTSGLLKQVCWTDASAAPPLHTEAPRCQLPAYLRADVARPNDFHTAEGAPSRRHRRHCAPRWEWRRR